MNRRTYIGVAAAASVGALAGCTTASDGSEYPPYPDSESTELSGDGPSTSESFEISLDGPTIIDLEHMGSDDFTVILDTPQAEETDADANETDADANETDADETDDDLEIDVGEGDQINPVAVVASASGPYDGRTLHSVDAGNYVLHALEADAEWEATVYDLPAYDDGVGIELPIDRDGEQYDVIGPINFGDESTVDFEFSVTDDGNHRVFLTDRTGTESLIVAELQEEGDESISQDNVSGVGYIEVLTVFSWNISVS